MPTTDTDLEVANEILRQLGGGRFVVMTGARNFIGSPNALHFTIPRAKDGANRVRITLTPADLYTLETFRVHGTNCTPCSRHEDLYNDMLQDIFQHVTGFDTHL